MISKVKKAVTGTQTDPANDFPKFFRINYFTFEKKISDRSSLPFHLSLLNTRSHDNSVHLSEGKSIFRKMV
jgi:hypothetical protein